MTKKKNNSNPKKIGKVRPENVDGKLPIAKSERIIKNDKQAVANALSEANELNL